MSAGGVLEAARAVESVLEALIRFLITLAESVAGLFDRRFLEEVDVDLAMLENMVAAAYVHLAGQLSA